MKIFPKNEFAGWGTRDQRVAANGGETFTAARFRIDVGPASGSAFFSGQMGTAWFTQRYAWIVTDTANLRIVASGTQRSWRAAHVKAVKVVNLFVESQTITYET